MARILVVDDNPENLRLLLLLLRAAGHEPVAAPGGAVALDLAAAAPPDLVLLDIQMPDMDGFETLRALRAQPPLARVPAVALTALAMSGDRELVLAAGFAAYIPKPIEPERLADQLAPFLPPAGPSC